MHKALAALAVVALAAACTGQGQDARPSHPHSSPPSSTASPTPTPTSTGWGPSSAEVAEAKRRVAAMFLKEKVGSLLMPQFAGRTATDPSAANRSSFGVPTVAQAIERYHVAGVIVMQQNVVDARQVRRLNAGLATAGRKDAPGLPLLIGVDQEGGRVQRVREGATELPAARTVGSTGRPALAKLLAKDSGEELRAMGFTLDFAPDADVGFTNPAIGDRSYSARPHRAARMVTAAVRGYRSAGVIPVVKHFPGHGSADTDSHTSLPRVTKSRAQLNRTDLTPFRSAIAGHVPVVMTGHLDVLAIDPGTPSSISRKVVHGTLRTKLGFRGVTITDSAMMEPLARYGTAEAAVRAVRAGEDIVLMPEQLRTAYNALLHAARSGRISAKTIARAATRVTALRLYAKRIGAHRPAWSVVGSAKHKADVRKVLDAAGD